MSESELDLQVSHLRPASYRTKTPTNQQMLKYGYTNQAIDIIYGFTWLHVPPLKVL